jgi:hypothetical protein
MEQTPDMEKPRETYRRLAALADALRAAAAVGRASKPVKRLGPA